MRQDNAVTVQQMEMGKEELIARLERDVAALEGQLRQCSQQMAEDQEALAQASAAKAELVFEVKNIQNLIEEKDEHFEQFKARMTHEYESKVSQVMSQSTTQISHLEELLDQRSTDFKTQLQEHEQRNQLHETQSAEHHVQNKELIDAIAQKNSELQGYQKIIEQIEQMQKKAKIENDKIKKEKDDLKKQLNNVHQVIQPEFEMKIQELKAINESKAYEIE